MAESWGIEMQALGQVLLANMGGTMAQHAIGEALDFDEGGLAWLWSCDRSMEDHPDSLVSVATEAFVSVFREEALGSEQLVGPSEAEQPIVSLHAIEAGDVPVTPTVSWLHSFSRDSTSLTEKIKRGHEQLTKQTSLKPQPSPLTRYDIVALR